MLKGPSTSQIEPNPHTIKAKAKYSPESGFCPTGCGLVQLTVNRTCPACGKPFKRQNTWDSAVKRFNEICEENRQLLDSKLVIMDLKIPIMLGRSFYSVPFSMVVEFDNMLNHTGYESFFKNILQTCKVLKN